MKINHILDVWIICKYFRGAPLIHSQFSQQDSVDYIHIFTNNEKDWIFWYYHQKIYPLEFSQMSVLSLSLYSRSIFQKLILKFEKIRKSCKNTKFFSEKTKFWLFIPRNGFHTFSRHSSDYLQHSVLSPKRFRLLEMKLEQKVQTLPKIAVFG